MPDDQPALLDARGVAQTTLEDALAFADEPLEWDPTPMPAPAAAESELGRVTTAGPITYYHDLIQGSDEWAAARRGVLTASEMKLVVAARPKVETRIKKDGTPYAQREWEPFADDDKCRAHVYELLSQRITKYTEPHYISDDMLRGKEDEIEARVLYAKHYAPVQEIGFITNNRWGFTLGYSPDGLVADDGSLECKSRRQKYQTQTIVECVIEKVAPEEFLFQVQTGLLVSERKWCDFVSFSGGQSMVTIRVWPDPVVQEAIIDSACKFEAQIAAKLAKYRAALKSGARLIPTERRIIQEMHL